MSDPSLTSRFDRAAIRAGASVALVFAVPLVVVAKILLDGDDKTGNGGGALAALLWFAAVLGFVLGAGVAAWHQHRGTPLAHGIVTSVGTYTVVQAAFVVVKIARSGSVNWMSVVFGFTMVTMAGSAGGLLGMYLQSKGLTPRGRTSEEGGAP